MNILASIKRRKILFLILLLTIASAIYVFNLFNGNIISKLKRKAEFNRYIKEKYSGTDYEICDVFYNFKATDYGAKVCSKLEGKEFIIEYLGGNNIYDHYENAINGYLEDYYIQKRFSDQISEILKGTINDNSIEINIGMSIEQGKYRDKETNYSKDMENEFIVSLEDKEYTQTRDEQSVIDAIVKVKNYFEKENHKGFRGVYFNFNKNKSMYTVLIKNSQLKISDDEVRGLIKGGYTSYKFDENQKIIINNEKEDNSEKEEGIN